MHKDAADKTSTVQNGNGEADLAGVSDSQSESKTAGGDVSVFDAVERLWRGRRTLVTFVGAFLIAGTVYLMGSRAEFQAGATLMPEEVSDNGLGNLGMLNQFSGLLGSSIPSDLMGSASQIPPDLYPEIARSTALLLALLEKTVYVPPDNQEMTLFEYLDDHKPFSLWESLRAAPGAILSSGDDEMSITPTFGDTTIINLSANQVAVVEDLKDRVGAEFDIRQGVIRVSVAMPDPSVSAQAANALVNEMTRYVSEYRTDRQRRKRDFIQQLYDEAETRFDQSLDDLAMFRDTHRNLANDLARTQEQRLQAEYDLSFSLYNSLSSRLEEARIQLQEEMSVFKVLQPVTVPLRKSYPPTLVTLLLCGIIGVFAGGGYLFFKPAFSRVGQIFRTGD